MFGIANRGSVTMDEIYLNVSSSLSFNSKSDNADSGLRISRFVEQISIRQVKSSTQGLGYVFILSLVEREQGSV